MFGRHVYNIKYIKGFIFSYERSEDEIKAKKADVEKAKKADVKKIGRSVFGIGKTFIPKKKLPGSIKRPRKKFLI